jgi:low affinity Fe/Cu permease
VNSHQGRFERFAVGVAHLAGRPSAFLIALIVIIAWAASGPLFGFSDTWQLIINTSTTIITFLMVFLIQNTQNRDTTALQVKLDALIFATRGAKNRLAAAEHMSDRDLEQLHEQYRQRAEQTLDVLHRRRRTGGKPT